VDTSGNESACSTAAGAVARIDLAVSPISTVNFGSVNLGSFADQTFTVSNTGGGTVSGTASTPAPFSIVSGSPFTLVGLGATQTVAVRFTPTASATATANANFTADGDTISRIVTGSATDTTPPTVSITAPAAGATITGAITVTATATDNVGVVGVQFKLDGANLGSQVTTTPYSVSWTTTSATNGSHTLTAVARDAAGNQTTSSGVSVTVGNGTAPLISSVSTVAISSSGATITWTTDKASDSQIDYGSTSAYGSSTSLATALVTSHSQTLSGLASNGLYHFRVKSRDSVGNLATSADFTFSTPAGSPPSTGLVGYWTFDEGSGTTASDSSGNGNTATLVNGPTWTAGKINQALAFDGLANYVSIPHANALNTYPLTVTAWIKTGTTSGARGIVNKYVAGSSNGYQLFMNNGSLCAWYLRDGSNYVYDGSECTLSTAGYANNQWHHVAFVVDGTGARLYVDGLQTASLGWIGTPGGPTTTQDVHIGHYPGPSGAEYFSGLLDDVRIYNRALSASEIAAFYGSLVVTTTPPVLSAVTVSSISSSGATVSWTTDKVSDTQVDYDTTTAYGSSTSLTPSLVTSHSQQISGLSPATVYHYRVKSRDAAGNLVVSSDATFKTADPPRQNKHKDWLDSIWNFFAHLF